MLYFSSKEETAEMKLSWMAGCKNRIRTTQSKRVDVLSVVGASHVLLTEADGVLALGDTVENLQVDFRDALSEK